VKDLCPVNKFLLLLCGLLLACGGGRSPGSGTDRTERDTVAFVERLRIADSLMLNGDLDPASSIAVGVYDSTASRSSLLDQHLRAVGILGQARRRSSDPDSALKLYTEGMQLARAANDSGWISVMWLNLGVAYDNLGDYEQALKAQLEAKRWKEALKDSANLARVLHNLGGLYWRQGQLPEAIDMLRRSVDLKRRHDTLKVASGLSGIGVVLIDAERYDSAIAVLRESLALQDRMATGDHRGMQLYNLGLAHASAGRPDSALHNYRGALLAAQGAGDVGLELRTLYGIGEVLIRKDDYARAKPVLDSSLAIAERLGSLVDMQAAHESLARLHEVLGDGTEALHHYREYQRLSDTLMSAEKDVAMNELRLRYDTERSDRENAELRAANTLTELRAERSRWIAVGIGVLTITVVILAWAIVQRNRRRARQREAYLEQQALRLQMDPHFLFNALNTVPGLYASGDTNTANDHVGHLSKFLRLVLETSRKRTIPLRQEIELVEHYLRISENRRPGSFTWDIKVMPYVQEERVAIPPMLIQPVVENAIEHGFNGVGSGHLSVLVDRAGSVLHIEVKDNGVGRRAASTRPSRRNGSSMGIDLVRKRIALFDKHTSLSEAVEVRDERSSDGQAIGTTVILRLRVQQINEHAATGDRG